MKGLGFIFWIESLKVLAWGYKMKLACCISWCDIEIFCLHFDRLKFFYLPSSICMTLALSPLPLYCFDKSAQKSRTWKKKWIVFIRICFGRLLIRFCLLFPTAGYVDLPDVFKVGFIMAFVNAVIWAIVGSFWWKFLGLYWFSSVSL